MDKGGVNHRVRRRRAAAQAFQIIEISPKRLRAGSSQGLSACIAANEAEHLVACFDQFRDQSRTNKSCRACDEYTHMNVSCS